jgi:hypothetical protein
MAGNERRTAFGLGGFEVTSDVREWWIRKPLILTAYYARRDPSEEIGGTPQDRAFFGFVQAVGNA